MKKALLRGAAISALSVGCAVAIATPLASLLFWGVLAVTGPINVAGMPFLERLYCWWEGLLRHATDPQYTGKLIVTAAAPMILLALAGLSLALRRGRRQLRPQRPGDVIKEPVRVASNLFGKARWMRLDEAASLYEECDPAIGGIPILELYSVHEDNSVRGVPYRPKDRTTWGKAGTLPLMIDPIPRGVISSGIIIGPPGFGKTSGFTIPALHQYRGSIVANDPSGEASKVTAAWRRDMGHTVAIIDPECPQLGAFNILKTIDINDPMAPLAIKDFVTEASGPPKTDLSKEEGFFKDKALSLNTALLADLLFDPTAKKTVREWRRRIVTPEREMKTLLRSIYANTRSDYARDIVGELMDTYHETASGIRSHATGDTEWLSLKPFADLLSEDTFDPTELAHGKMTCFMQFPSHMLRTTPSVGRVVLGSLMRSVMRAKGRVATTVPFLIDETYQFKYQASLAVVRDEGRKYGMPLYTMWQSEGQISEAWGPQGIKAWFNTSAWRMYIGGVDDPMTAKELSNTLGTYTVLAPNEGTSTSAQAGFSGQTTRGMTEGASLQARKLASDDELRTEFHSNEALWLRKGQPAARFAIPAWYCREDMRQDLEENSFLQEYKQKELVHA